MNADLSQVGTPARPFVLRVLDDLVTTLFPSECACCAGPLTHASTVPVCAACLARLTPSSLPACARCGEALFAVRDFEAIRTIAPTLCRECRLAPPAFTRAVAYGTYTAELRELIHLLKFARVPAAADLLGRHLAQAVLTLEPELTTTRDASPNLLVVAVPLFRQRQRQRGFNQSILLAESAVKQLRRLRPAWSLTAAHSLLDRQRSTESSFVLSRRGRRRNLSGAFRLRPGATALLAGRELLLLDDIYTSGATARECARALIRGGAARVWVATLARAQKRSVLSQVHDQIRDREADTAAWDLALPLNHHASLPED